MSSIPNSQTPNTSFGLAQNYRDVTGPCHPVGRWEQNRNVNKVHTRWQRVFSHRTSSIVDYRLWRQQTCLCWRRIKWGQKTEDINLHLQQPYKLDDCNVKHVFVHRWDQASSFGVHWTLFNPNYRRVTRLCHHVPSWDQNRNVVPSKHGPDRWHSTKPF